MAISNPKERGETIEKIYLDHGATTPVDEAVLAEMLPYFTRAFGNPSSKAHRYGWDALDAIELARLQVSLFLGAQSDEIFFTSGATESNFTTLFGLSRSRAAATRRHIVSSPIEHKSVLACLEVLEKQGFQISWVKPREDGRTHVEDVLAAVRPDTLLVTLMHVNNEIGVVNPLQEISIAVKRKFPEIYIHSDATQAVGKIPLSLKEAPIDFLSLSAHKIYGPKGVGGLFIRKSVQADFTPMMRGGGQESGIRGGTVNVPGVVGFGKACEISQERLAEDNARIHVLAKRLFDRIATGFGDLRLNGSVTHRVSNNLSLCFPGINGETLLKELGTTMAVSSGSACSAGSSDVSHVLRGIGLSDDLARSTLRFTLGRSTTADEVDRAADLVLAKISGIRAKSAPAVEQTTRKGLELKTIATVESGVTEPKYIEWSKTASRIVVDPQYLQALDGLEQYSHVVVLFWMHEVSTCKLTHVPQAKYRDVPEVGIFACRCPYRPNPIAITTVKLLKVDGNVLYVEGLDAVNGTPVVDLKPYTPQMDGVEGEVRVPGWVGKLTY